MIDFTQVSIETMQDVVRAIALEVRDRLQASGQDYSRAFEHSIAGVIEHLDAIDYIIKEHN